MCDAFDEYFNNNENDDNSKNDKIINKNKTVLKQNQVYAWMFIIN